jgi:5-dehydro-2-deoxygluconokinase
MTELARRRAPAKMSEPARRTGEAVLGWVGFAVGRTIWWDRLEEWLGGASAQDAADGIGANYLRLVAAYTHSGARP